MADELRRQLETDLAKWKAAGMDEEAKAVEERLANFDTEMKEAEAAATTEVVPAEDFGTGRYEDRTVAQLRALAASKGLSTSGTKDDLVAVLREG